MKSSPKNKKTKIQTELRSAVKVKRPPYKVLYSCGTDFQHDIGEALDYEGSQRLYSSIESLKKRSKCWKQCGIVKLKLSLMEWIEDQDFTREVE